MIRSLENPHDPILEKLLRIVYELFGDCTLKILGFTIIIYNLNDMMILRIYNFCFQMG